MSQLPTKPNTAWTPSTHAVRLTWPAIRRRRSRVPENGRPPRPDEHLPADVAGQSRPGPGTRLEQRYRWGTHRVSGFLSAYGKTPTPISPSSTTPKPNTPSCSEVTMCGANPHARDTAFAAAKKYDGGEDWEGRDFSRARKHPISCHPERSRMIRSRIIRRSRGTCSLIWCMMGGHGFRHATLATNGL